MGQEIGESPILWKMMPNNQLRVVFPVSAETIQLGTVAAIVTLHDLKTNRTLYAHPIHAGPETNPLLANLDGPMAAPKSQPDRNGDKATSRMIEHKRALWQRFCWDRETVGEAEASSHWKAGYYWALRRLYFCSWCFPCKWGSPYFDPPAGMEPVSKRHLRTPARNPASPLAAEDAAIVSDVLASEPWRIEVAYAARGGFEVEESPYLIQPLDEDWVLLVFPTEVSWIQGGTLVALAAVYQPSTRLVWHVQCLSAGPEPEILFMRGRAALGLPYPGQCSDSGLRTLAYATWRKEGWTRFWLDELEKGLKAASRHWLGEFPWALERLFGGNRLRLGNGEEAAGAS
jgi:hypothetical protein